MWISATLLFSVLFAANGEEKGGKGYKESPVLTQKAYKEKDTSGFLGVQIERDDAHVVVRSLPLFDPSLTIVFIFRITDVFILFQPLRRTPT